MKKIIFIAALFFLLSCKKETEIKIEKEEETVQLYTDNQIIGKWVYDVIKINGVASSYVHNPKCQQDNFKFVNRSGQDHYYVETISRPYGSLDCSISQTGMYWKLKGGYLILNFGATEFNYKILRLTATNFDISIKIDYDKDGKLDDVELYAVKKDCTGETYCQI